MLKSFCEILLRSVLFHSVYASTYSDLEDEGSSDDLESEVERTDLTSRRQRHQQLVPFYTPTSTRSGNQEAVFYQIRNDLSQFVVKLQEHGRSVNLKFQAALTTESDVLSALGELTSTLNMVVKRLEKTEHRIQSMDEKIESTSSASDSAGLKAVKKVPVIVRVSNCSV